MCTAGAACGGGGGGGQSSSSSPPPATPDFTLSVSPTSVSIAAGSSANVTLLASALNGFSSSVSVQFSGMPTGVSVSPSSITLTPGTSLLLTLSVQSGTAASTATVTFTGTSGTLSHAANLSVTITSSGSGSGSGSLNTRTTYVRSDAVTEYYLSVNTHWEVYNQPTGRFFVTDPFSSSIFVYDSTTEQLIGKIAVPGAYGIDQTADGSTLYVGTLVGDVYTLDPVGMKVTHRYIASQIGPYGYGAMIALPLSNGDVALLAVAGGIPSVDGSISFAVWNPSTNSIAIYASAYGAGAMSGVPVTTVCGSLEDIGGFAVTADRSAVILGSIDSDSTLCEVNASTGAYSYAVTSSGFILKIVTSPDGKYIALPTYPAQVVLYDANTLNQVAQFPVAGDMSSASNMVFSQDSKTLYISNGSIEYSYNVSTHQEIGWFPSLDVSYASGGSAVGPATSPDFEAEDGTGLLAGPLEEGFGFLDTTQMQTGPLGSVFTNAYLNPATGPTSGGTVTQWGASTNLTEQGSVFFGKNPSPSFSVSTTGNVSATTPPGNPGPVAVRVFTTDGGMQFVADGFSYGPTILEVTPNMTTAGGGADGVVYGYGFGPVASSTAIPSGLSVSVGGTAAPITGFNPNAYGLLSPPFPLQAIYFTIPAGAQGTANVTVTSSSGSATANNALTYLPAAKQYPLPGASLAQGIYDPQTGLYYFTDINKIQVFSLAQGQWLSPISIPAPSGATQRFWGISLSADDSVMAVADIEANVIYLLNPASPSTVHTFPFAPPLLPQGMIAHPAGIAVTNSGVVYIAAYMEGGTGLHSFYKLDTSTNTLTDYGIDGPEFSSNGVPQDPYLRVALSADGTRVYFNSDGYVFNIDTATDTLFNASIDVGCCYGTYDLALSPNQTQFAASDYLYDADLNAQSFFSMNDREALDIAYVYGEKYSPDGSLLFDPATNGIDVFDGHVGSLRDRIALPFALSSTYDALVSDGTDNVLLAITGAGDGIAEVDLSSIPEPPPLSYAAARSSQSPMEAARQGVYAPTANPDIHLRLGVNPSKYTIRPIPHVTKSIPLHPSPSTLIRR